ncbi:MAG: hypothetical protein AABX47_10160 [Nanoarchaeota archaeon]
MNYQKTNTYGTTTTAAISSKPSGASNKPLAKFKAGAVVATIWANSAQGAAGEVVYNSITLDRRYQDKSGQWQSTSSMRVNDLPKAALVLQKAYEYLVIKEQQESPERAGTPTYTQSAITEEEALVA